MTESHHTGTMWYFAHHSSALAGWSVQEQLAQLALDEHLLDQLDHDQHARAHAGHAHARHAGGTDAGAAGHLIFRRAHVRTPRGAWGGRACACVRTGDFWMRVTLKY